MLENRYTPSQLAAIKAAESAIDPRDLVTQNKNRVDIFALPYKDDLAEVDPVTDHAEKLSHHDISGNKFFRKTNPVERDDAIAQIATETLAKLYPDGIPDEENPDPTERKRLEEAMQASLAQAYMDPRTAYRMRVKVLVSHNVVNQTRMGKIRSMYYLSVAGNGNGLLGIGEGKSVEPEEGRKQSLMAAIRNMKPVPRYENRTIYGNLEHKVGATKVQLMARPPGIYSFLIPPTDSRTNNWSSF